MSTSASAGAALRVHSHQPYKAETPLDRLVASFITPQRDLYVRTHGKVQHLDEATHRLEVSGRVSRAVEFSVADLRQRFAAQTILSGPQCAGNRRADLQGVAKTEGDPWAGGAVGNVQWTGARLRDVLAAANAATDAGLQVAFYSTDEIEVENETGRFGVSIPMPKALTDDVLLAYEMNGELLTAEHGHPLRVVVPGYAGVRSAQWVQKSGSKTILPTARSSARLQAVSARVAKGEADWNAGLTINAMPLNSAICEPQSSARLKAGASTIRGWATASERAIKRVDVSLDGGRSWRQASLEQDAAHPHAWTFWRLEAVLAEGEHELVVPPSTRLCRRNPTSPTTPGTIRATWLLTAIAFTLSLPRLLCAKSGHWRRYRDRLASKPPRSLTNL